MHDLFGVYGRLEDAYDGIARMGEYYTRER